MPAAIRHCCRSPGCPMLVTGRYCEKHAREAERQRGSSAERGYGRRWRRFRRWYLTQHPLCVQCEAEGRLTEATEVHHVIAVRVDASLQYEESNLQSLCHACHSRVTARENQASTKAPRGGGYIESPDEATLLTDAQHDGLSHEF